MACLLLKVCSAFEILVMFFLSAYTADSCRLVHAGRLTVLDLANNSISAKGASHVAEYVKKSKGLLWINLYMNDIKDEVEVLNYKEN